MYRVLKPGGVCFISVFPWWPSFYGSHFSDYISESFFHLSRPNDWVREKLDDYSSRHPAQADLVCRHMWNEYRSLNKITLDEFFQHVHDSGFEVGLSELSSYRADLRSAPKDRRFTELMACGASMALHKP